MLLVLSLTVACKKLAMALHSHDVFKLTGSLLLAPAVSINERQSLNKIYIYHFYRHLFYENNYINELRSFFFFRSIVTIVMDMDQHSIDITNFFAGSIVLSEQDKQILRDQGFTLWSLLIFLAKPNKQELMQSLNLSSMTTQSLLSYPSELVISILTFTVVFY